MASFVHANMSHTSTVRHTTLGLYRVAQKISRAFLNNNISEMRHARVLKFSTLFAQHNSLTCAKFRVDSLSGYSITANGENIHGTRWRKKNHSGLEKRAAFKQQAALQRRMS